ncbi:MAG TPA: coenzyme F420-0:L-glutamate ligase [Terriglobales bacterium]|nr:coenzyme F420-0:L-glutamate ligase [Terriglobales bacterium]
MKSSITCWALTGIPEVRAGDSLADLILGATRKHPLRAGDILVVKHKIVAKAEGRTVRLDSVTPSARARRWANRWQRDARLAELALREARRVVRMKKGVLITETRHGFVCANSGVDLSNVDGGHTAVLLPVDPDRSARRLHLSLKQRLGVHVPVIIADSFGRPWREGLAEAALGSAGMRVLADYRGRRDPHGYTLHATAEAVADELAALAGLACGKLERAPACIIRGFRYERGSDTARRLLRKRERDLFR